MKSRESVGWESAITDLFLRKAAAEDPKLKAAAVSYAAVNAAGTVTRELLAPIVELVAAGNRTSTDWGIDFLGSLASRYPLAAEAVESLMNSRKAAARFAAVCCVGIDLSHTVAVRILRKGLKDKASTVRWKAANVARKNGLVVLIPEIEALLVLESGEKQRVDIDCELRYLRDGYIINDLNEQTVSVSVVGRRGTIGRLVSRVELADRGVEAIISELKRDAA